MEQKGWKMFKTTRKGLPLAALALVLVGSAMLVSALVVSNSLTWSNTVTSQAITLSQTTASETTDYDNLPSNPVLGQTYDTGILASASSDVGAWTLNIQITGTTASSDVTVKYWDGDSYESVTLSGTTTLTGTVSEAAITHGNSYTQALSVMYNVAGTFGWTVTASV